MIQKGQAPLLNLVQARLSVIYWVIPASYKAFPSPQCVLVQHLSCVGCMPNEGFPKRAKPLFQRPKFRQSCSCQGKNNLSEKVLQFWRKRLCPFEELVYSSSPALVFPSMESNLACLASSVQVLLWVLYMYIIELQRILQLLVKHQ